MLSRCIILITIVICCSTAVTGFVSQTHATPPVTSLLATPSSSTTEVTDKGLLKRDRYVATNRFAVRLDKAAKFEKRWATRKSRLASLDGFKYFHLMRRVSIDE